MDKRKPKVFISYSTEDSVFADLVKMKLNSLSIDVWLDQDKLGAGEEWRNEIDLGIINSDALVLILTPESCKSPYVTYEWAFAIGRMKKIIPILYKAAEIHPRLSVLQYLDFTDHRKGPWEQLHKQIELSSTENIEGKKPSNLVSGMTIDDLKGLLSATLSLANATAKTEGRNTSQEDFSEAAKNIANANLNLGQLNTKSPIILWVDDRPDNNINERKVFSSLGFTFDIALSTNDALQKLKATKYNAIISDMGRIEGPEEGLVLLERVRKIDKTIPYFIYAGSNSIKYKKEAQELGATGSTNSPAELIELVTKHSTK